MPEVVDLRGRTFGSLTVVEEAPRHANGRTRWVCRCTCGGTKVVLAYKLHSGRVGNCTDCGRSRLRGTRGTSKSDSARRGVGTKYTPEYASWLAMRERCNTPGRPNYRYYGGRGIRVCSEWDNFAQFLADLGPRPPGTTLDRIDHDGHYEPGNCRWADLRTQNRNRRAPVRTAQPKRLDLQAAREIRAQHAAGATQVQLAAQYGVATATIYDVIRGNSWRDVSS